MNTKARDHSVDHMRALAAALVFYWHGIHQRGVPFTAAPDNWILSVFEEGWIGVTVFIVITGFIFTNITNGRDIIYFQFLRNRVLRILPLLFIVMLFNVSFKDFPEYGLILFFNLLGGGLVPGAWTLAVEFQFYIAYPYIRKRLVHESLLRTVLSCLGLALIFLFFRYCFFVGRGQVQSLAYWTIFGQIDAFLAGIVGGVVYLRAKESGWRYQRVMAAATFILSACAFLATMAWFHERGGYYNQPTYPSKSAIWLFLLTWMSLLCGAIVASYAIMMRGVSSRLSRWFGYIGEISYSTYLLHFLTLALFHKVYAQYVGYNFSDDPLISNTIILLIFHYPLTLAISALSYEFIEKSFHQKSDYLRPIGGEISRVGDSWAVGRSPA